MQNLMSIWARLDMRRRVLLAGVTLAVFLGVLGLTRLATTPDLSLLYAGLEEAAAGDAHVEGARLRWHTRDGRDAAAHGMASVPELHAGK